MLQHRLIYLILVRGHLLLGAAVEHIDLFRAEADSRAAAVHRGEASAKDGDFLADKDWLAEVDLLQEGQASDDTVEVRAGDDLVVRASQRIREHTARADVDGGILFQQVGQLDILADDGVESHLDAQRIEIFVNLLLRHLAWQTPNGGAADHHAARRGIHVEDRDRIALLG